MYSPYTGPCHTSIESELCAKTVPGTLAEFYFSRGLQRLYTATCTILQKTVNRFLCLLIVFRESKVHQLNFEGRD